MKFLVSDDVRVPTALGFFRPAVVLPSWTLRDLSPDELKVIVLHELAHLRRWDDWTNLAQKFVKAIFFFHPAVWWIDSRLALEREIACDDMVLEQTANARTLCSLVWSRWRKKSSPKKCVQGERWRWRKARWDGFAKFRSVLRKFSTTNVRIESQLASGSGHDRHAGSITVGAMPYAPELISFQNKTQTSIFGSIRRCHFPADQSDSGRIKAAGVG